MMRNLALLGLRLTVGGYVAGHGAQKLFGSFGGPGLDRAAEHFETMRLEPGREMAAIASGSELLGGALTALGLGGPLGPIAVASTMAVAAGTAHRGKPPFAQQGGPELALTNAAAALTLAAVGPGALSLDTVLRVRVPKVLTVLALAGGVAASTAIIRKHLRRSAEQAADELLPVTPTIDLRDEVHASTPA